MDKKVKQCIDMLRQLVSDVQGAPYPVKFVPVIDHGLVVGVLTQDVLAHRS